MGLNRSQRICLITAPLMVIGSLVLAAGLATIVAPRQAVLFAVIASSLAVLLSVGTVAIAVTDNWRNLRSLGRTDMAFLLVGSVPAAFGLAIAFYVVLS